MANSSRLHQEYLVRGMFVLCYRNLILFFMVPELSFYIPRCAHSIPSLVWSVAFIVPTEPLLCKFADGGQKKRQNQGKYLQNGRPWARDGETVSYSLSLKWTCCFDMTLQSFEFDHFRSALADCECTLHRCLYDLTGSELRIVFLGRNDACIWPHSLTKWVSDRHGLTENSPSPPGKQQ